MPKSTTLLVLFSLISINAAFLISVSASLDSEIARYRRLESEFIASCSLKK
jgi:hypothetical protein